MDEFEKLDQDLMKGLKSLREKPVPPEIRRNFRRSVEERVLGMGRPAAFSWAIAGVPALVLVMGLALCWFNLRPHHVRPLVTEAPATQEILKVKASAPAAQIAVVSAPAMLELPAPAPSVRAQAQLPPVSESELVDEIEMLKELGVWTEEDEAEIGIPADQVFEELEMMAGEWSQNSAAGNLPQGSRAG